MAFIFRDTYSTEFADKRSVNMKLQRRKNAVSTAQSQIAIQNYTNTKSAISVADSVIGSLENERQILMASINSVKSTEPVDEERLNDLTGQLSNLNDRLNGERNRKNDLETSLRNNEIIVINQILESNAQLNGFNSNLTTSSVASKFFVAKQFDPNVSPVSFVNETIASTGDTGLANVTSRIRKVATAAERFRNIIEGRPDGSKAGLEARDPYAIFEPSVCGLIALDNEGNILPDTKYNIPFQYIFDFKDQKSSNYQSTSPIGRFEPHRAYSGAEPYTITFELGYHAYESGPNSDEGFIQEVKDKWFASQYPIYGKNQQNGVRTYGTPNKYLLNVFSRYINIPVYVEEVSISEEFALDPRTFFAMGFKMSVSLKTAYRLSKVVSGDDVITNGIRGYSNNF